MFTAFVKWEKIVNSIGASKIIILSHVTDFFFQNFMCERWSVQIFFILNLFLDSEAYTVSSSLLALAEPNTEYVRC
jgi:hypothetical protein